jgi:RHS repeat-associated protein
LVATSVYDFNTGLITSTTDANAKTTTFEYNDPLNRQTRVNLPDGGRTTRTYVDAHQCGPYIETRTLLNASGSETDSYAFFDGLGRAYRAFTFDNQDPSNPWLTVDTQYDSLGRAWRVSNPYRSSGCTSAVNPSGNWTTTTYDALSRTVAVTTPDGAQVSTVYSAVTTGSYIGSSVTVTDPSGKARKSITDASGRVIQVIEDPNGVAYQTNYTYDVLNNLRKVEQGTQVRFYGYDSLSRVVRARTVEQSVNTALNWSDPVTGNSGWTMGLSYDANANVTSRVDARNIATTLSYDPLNRNYAVNYSDGTPTVYRYFDGAVNGRGRLYWEQAVGISANVFDAYDAMGRATQFHQVFWVNGNWGSYFNVQRTYDKAGNVTSQTYPSGHTANYSYDAAGRLTSYNGNLGDGVQRTYSAGIGYSPFGMQQEQFGTQTPLYYKLHYNVRGQLYDMRVSTYSLQANEWDWNRGAIVNYYSANYSWGGNSSGTGPDNNGNVTRQQHWIPTDDSLSNYTYTQDTYSYDSLNRLSSVTELHGGPWGQSGTDYVQAYSYDRYGNRTINGGATWGTGINNKQFTVDANTNRLGVPAGQPGAMSYDAVGNLTFDSYSGEGTRTFDPENRMTQAWANNQWQTYTYDADGRRVKRNVNGGEVWQVYGIGGELLAEYKVSAAPFLPTKEYGYRGGQLLVTMASGDDVRLTRFVTNLYYGALQRDPNSTELQNGINSLAAAGVQGQPQLLQAAKDLARSLFLSTSYETSPYRTDSQYVGDLYYTYLHRAADDGGLGWWTAQVPGSGRANVCNAFEASSEFATLVSTLYGTATSDNQRTEQFVNNFYLGAYGRFATATELQQQRDALNAAAAQGLVQVQTQAETFGRSLFAGQINDSSISDTQYVTNLYEAFLQRGPDAGGLGWWSGQATLGQGRQNVLNAFAVCGAFRELAGTLYRESFWLVSDHLGTPRMIIDKSGSLAGVKRHDYLPFGEEVYAGVGGRTTAQGYSGDSTRQKFTGYEADSEIGLNFAQARYQSSAQGRFTSVDPLGKSANVLNPQSFNRYSYVLNNPVRFTDPTGMRLSDIGVVQTDNAAHAAIIQHNSDVAWMRIMNAQWAAAHGGTVTYDEDGKASFTPDDKFWSPGEVAFTGYYDDEGVLTWWYGVRYSLPAESVRTSVDLPIAQAVSQPLNDFRSLDIAIDVGYDFGISYKQDRFGRCYFGVRGGGGLGLFPVSGSYTEGEVYTADAIRASDPDTVKTALSGWSNGLQVTLPTTDVLATSVSTDPIVGALPTGGPFTLESGHGTGIPSVSASKEYSIKIPKWMMFPVQRITRCK